MKFIFLNAYVFAFLVAFISGASANAAEADHQPRKNPVSIIGEQELARIKASNGGLEFVGWGLKRAIDAEHFSVVLYQTTVLVDGKEESEAKGRKYAFAVIKAKPSRIALLLETGELGQGEYPYPQLATRKRSVFSFGDDYLEHRRVEYRYDIAGGRIVERRELPPVMPSEGIP